MSIASSLLRISISATNSMSRLFRILGLRFTVQFFSILFLFLFTSFFLKREGEGEREERKQEKRKEKENKSHTRQWYNQVDTHT